MNPFRAAPVSSRLSLLVVWLIALVAFAPALLTAQVPEAVSRTAPALYAERAAPLLTPLERILATPAPTDGNAVAQVLADETIHLVAEDGRAFRVYQIVYRALKEASLKALGEDVFSYGRDRQKFHLVRAVSIQPDGSEQAVAADAVLVQSPQRQADLAIYDDTTEVRIIYPRVPVGGATQVIYVVEDTSARMPGAYTSRRVWGSNWPTALDRQVVELPAALAARLQAFHLGPDAVEPTREKLADGGIRLAWQRTSMRARTSEVGRAPSAQVGPALHLTTLATWDDVAGWFQSLIAGRDRLPPALAAESEGWLRDVKERDAKIRLLFSKVADEIRYTSLALDDGDYQPQSCADVWARRHGDCKDKSNLLAALLRHAGIPAHVALVNTRHLGLVDRRAPDFRVFTHAIVAIPDGKGGYLFCDPTSASGQPGVLSPSVTDRDALIVRGGRAEWARIPSQSAGRLDYVFELALNADGEVSGWMTLTADAIYGVWERERYRNQDHRDRRDALAGTVRGFFPGAEVIDIVPPDPATAPGPAVARAYFVVSGQGDAAAGPGAVRFPRSADLLLDLGTTEARETTYFVYPDEIRVATSFTLPPGFAAETLPSPFKLESPVLAAESRWRSEAGVLHARLAVDIRQNAISPREFGRVYQGMLALKSWLAQPVTLRANAAAPAAPAADATTIDLPLMPTGRGQLDLIEKRYPFSGDWEKRRAALRRAIQYFPNDAATAFEAGVFLAVLDWNEDRNTEAHDRVGALLAAHRRSVSPSLVAWGESLQALALRDLGRADEAVAVFTRIARDTSLHAWRRSQDARNAIGILSKSDAAAAFALAKESSLLVSEHQPALLAHAVRLGLELKAEADLQAHLAAVARAQPSEFESFVAQITKLSLEWAAPEGGAQRERWFALAATLVPAPDEELKAVLDEARASEKRLAIAADIQRRLREATARPPLDAWFQATSAPAPETWSAYVAERKKLVDQSDSDGSTRLGVRMLMTQPPGEETLARLWRIASDADWHERRAPAACPPTLLPLLLDLCDLVPKPHDTYYDGRFLRAQGLARRGDYAGESAIFKAFFADPQFPDAFRGSAHARFGLCCENLGDYEAALAAYRELEDNVAESDRDADAVLRAVLINLHLGRRAEALRLIEVLRKVTEPTLTKATHEYFIREFVALARSGSAETFWAAHATWWPQWEALAAKLKLAPAGGETVTPVIPELSVLGDNMRRAAKNKNSAAFWREFRTLVSAARWLPSLAPEVSGTIQHPIAQAPAQAKALNQLVLAQLAIPGIPETNARLRDFHAIATRHDIGDHAGALAAAATFFAEHPNETVQRPAIARVRALSALATQRELTDASAELERQLADPALAFKRAMSVELLAKLYRARGLGEEERTLLQRELANPHIVANPDAHGMLSTRLEDLGGSLKLAAEVRAWLAAHPLPWYDYAEPASLADPRLRDLAAVLENPERQFNAVETIKLRLLAAQNPDLGLGEQGEALATAVNSLCVTAPLLAESRALANAFADHAAFDEAIRTRFVWLMTVDAYFGGRPEEFAQWKDHPLGARYNEKQKEFLTILARSHEFDFDNADALTTFADELRAKELDEKEVIQLQRILEAYLRLDELDRARALVESIPGWNYVSGYGGSKASNTLHFTRTLRGAEERAPVHRALVARVREHFKELPAKPAARYRARRVSPGELPELAPAEIRQTGLWMIGAHRVGRQGFAFWERFVWSLHHDPATRALALELIGIALRAAPEDDIREEVLESLFYSVDTDDAATLASLREIVAPYTDAAAHPLAARYLRVQNARLAVRLGEVKDFESSLRVLSAPDDGFESALMALKSHLQRNDAAALKRVFRNLDGELMLHPGLLPFTVPALERAGLKTEHRLARDAAEKELRGAILSAWVDASGFSISRALNLAEMLGRPDVFPSGWVAFVTERCADPMDRGRVLITDAWLRSDWTTAAREAQAVLRDYPTFHRFHWYAGAALHRAGKVSEARPHLETYVRYANDEVERAAAVALLGSEGAAE